MSIFKQVLLAVRDGVLLVHLCLVPLFVDVRSNQTFRLPESLFVCIQSVTPVKPLLGVLPAPSGHVKPLRYEHKHYIAENTAYFIRKTIADSELFDLR